MESYMTFSNIVPILTRNIQEAAIFIIYFLQQGMMNDHSLKCKMLSKDSMEETLETCNNCGLVTLTKETTTKENL